MKDGKAACERRVGKQRDNVYEIFTEPKSVLSSQLSDHVGALAKSSDSNSKRSYSDAINALVSSSPIQKIKAGSTILDESDRLDSVYYIIQGTVTLFMMDEKGNEVLLNYITEGNFVGTESLCFPDSTAGVIAAARTEVTFAECSFDRFRILTEEHPCLLSMAFSQVSSALVSMRKRYSGSVFLKVTDRVKNVFKALIHDRSTVETESEYVVNVTRHEISRIVGCSREMIGRVLKDLQSEGYLTMHGNTRKITLKKSEMRDDS